MNLLSHAKKLMASGRLSAISAIAITPLATAVSDAQITYSIGGTDVNTILHAGPTSGSGIYISSTGVAFSSANESGDGTYNYSLSASFCGYDASVFGAVSNATRSGYFSTSGYCSGSLAAGTSVNLNYWLLTVTSGGTTSAVPCTVNVTVCDDYGNKYVLSGAAMTSAANETDSTTHDLQLVASGTGAANSWSLEVYYDWNIDDTYPSTYSASDLMMVQFNGILSFATTVPEPSAWGLFGATAVLGAAAFSRRKKK
jgi:hypothetical protein